MLGYEYDLGTLSMSNFAANFGWAEGTGHCQPPFKNKQPMIQSVIGIVNSQSVAELNICVAIKKIETRNPCRRSYEPM